MKPRLLQILFLFTLSGLPVMGMFMLPDTQKVPLDRLFVNLEKQLQKDTNDFQVTYYLARLHSMAYAKDVAEMEVTKKEQEPIFGKPYDRVTMPQAVQKRTTPGARVLAQKHLTNAVVYYEKAIVLLRKSKDQEKQKYMILPTQLGLAWALDQASRRNEAVKEYRKTLQLAWRIEVEGDFVLRDWLEERWGDIKSGKNPVHKSTRGSWIGLGPCYSAETIGYLLKLLDPAKDAKEIADLKEKEKELSMLGRAVTPVLIPVKAGLEFTGLVNSEANVTFDLDGSGIQKKWGWITTNAAWLVFDREGTRQITSGLQMMGNVTFWIFWENGYQPMAALDDDGDGVLRGNELKGFALWQDKNGNGISETGEVLPLSEFGIISISCKHEVHESGIPWSPQGVTLKNGTTLPSYDWIVPGKPDR